MFMQKRPRKGTNVRYYASSHNLSKFLYDLFFNLYEKSNTELTPLEVELKYRSPQAEDWIFQYWPCKTTREASMEAFKKILTYKNLQPNGLNEALVVSGKDGWLELSDWLKKRNNP